MKSPKNAPARCSMSAPTSREPISKARSRAKGPSRPMPLSFMPPKGAISPAGFRRDDALVDADDAVFEGLGDPPDAADVAAIEIGSTPSLPSPASGRERPRAGG